MRRDVGADELLQLWIRFSEFQATQLSASTIARDYDKIAKRLVLMPPTLTTAAAVESYLMQRYAPDTARRTLKRLSACCDWAVNRKYLKQNPFKAMIQDLKTPRRKKSWIDTRAFTAAERDAILATIASDIYTNKFSPTKHSYYSTYYRFLFFTGCRLEESSPLKWEHIEHDYTVIHFREALPADTRILGETKTSVDRTFPCNASMRQFLQSLPKHHDLVFPSPSGRPIDYHNLLKRLWTPVVTALVRDGLVKEYLPHKHTRQTFITLAIEAGMNPKDVAQIVGNSPEVINDYYLAPKREISVPEL